MGGNFALASGRQVLSALRGGKDGGSPMSKTEHDYEVGRGKLPLHSRFEKGQSRRPRPKACRRCWSTRSTRRWSRPSTESAERSASARRSSLSWSTNRPAQGSPGVAGKLERRYRGRREHCHIALRHLLEPMESGGATPFRTADKASAGGQAPAQFRCFLRQ